MKDNRENEQNRYSLLTVRDAEHAMFVFSIFAVAIIVGIFSFELLIRGSGILKSLGVVLGNVSSVLSGSTLLTIFEEGVNLMFFRRAREEYAKLKKERAAFEEELAAVEAARASLKKETKQLEELKAELSQAATNVGDGTSKAGNVESDTKQPKQSTKPKN